MKNLFRVCLLVAALLVAGRSELAQANYDHCYAYLTSRIVSSYQYGTYCGATGNGCQYCWNDNDGGYCYSVIGDEYCVSIDHQTF